MSWRDRVVTEALTWDRTPYHHEANIKGVGVDCAMILTEVYHEAGLIERVDPRPYPPDWHLHRSQELFLGWVEQFCVRTDDPQPGDIALFRFGRCHSHAAIVIAWPKVIHAVMMNKQVTVEDIPPEYVVERDGRFYTFKDTA